MTTEITLGNFKVYTAYGVRRDINKTCIVYSDKEIKLIDDIYIDKECLPEDSIIINFATAESLQKHIDRLKAHLEWQIKCEQVEEVIRSNPI